jgi:hypothetical protein
MTADAKSSPVRMISAAIGFSAWEVVFCLNQ